MSEMPQFDLYAGVRGKAAFKQDGNLTDPSSITLTLRTPAGVETTGTYTSGGGASGTLTIVKSSTGNYYFDFTLTERGIWAFRFRGTGGVITAMEQAVECMGGYIG